jgi:Putative Ig domain/Domain of unknown function DUF11
MPPRSRSPAGDVTATEDIGGLQTDSWALCSGGYILDTGLGNYHATIQASGQTYTDQGQSQFGWNPGGNGAYHVIPGSNVGEVLESSQSQVTVPLSVPTASPPQATAGIAYSQQLTAAGGTAPYTWTVTSGTLPAGLTLTSDGTITGTPVTAGTSAFTVQATDSGNPAQTATGQLSLTVAADKADLAVTVTGPATVTAGANVTYTLTVTDKGPAAASSVTAVLATSGLAGVTPSTGGTSNTVTIFGTKLTGSRWTVASLAPGQSDTFTVTGSAPAAGKTASATGGALATTPDPDPLNNISMTTTKTAK